MMERLKNWLDRHDWIEPMLVGAALGGLLAAFLVTRYVTDNLCVFKL